MRVYSSVTEPCAAPCPEQTRPVEPDSQDSHSTVKDPSSNLALIPDLIQTETSSPSSPRPTQTVDPPCPDSPLLIHGYSVEEYQSIYHSVVDEMLLYVHELHSHPLTTFCDD